MRRNGMFTLILAFVMFASLNAGTTLSKAAISGDLAKVKACIDGGEKVDEVDKWGMTPLIWAVYYKYLPVVQYLLDQKADPNIQSKGSYRSIPKQATALSVAAYYGLEEHASLLLKHGANSELVDNNNKKAIDYAKTYNFTPIVNMLSKEKRPPAVIPTEKPIPSPKIESAPVHKTESVPAPKVESAPAPTRTNVTKEKPITNQDVMNMLLKGQGDSVVIRNIKKSPKQAMDVSPKAQAKLRELGVSTAVIQAMIQRAGK